ncbi:hypothetical protein ACFV7R_13730 [Streptomyces sp. NPDC059866]|uniref:hypothetical protein n=1 Tax=Streptomyces sp. NPDC059866 TaxID=3346978 RepID=UPI00364C253A
MGVRFDEAVLKNRGGHHLTNVRLPHDGQVMTQLADLAHRPAPAPPPTPGTAIDQLSQIGQ